ncbi:MAG TPA: hypothetical protein ENJ79_03240, partial [Gammaproteobacteria bacterium]|nr:hypothetical protein [Gammaproteobacteria bacterium]
MSCDNPAVRTMSYSEPQASSLSWHKTSKGGRLEASVPSTRKDRPCCTLQHSALPKHAGKAMQGGASDLSRTQPLRPNAIFSLARLILLILLSGLSVWSTNVQASTPGIHDYYPGSKTVTKTFSYTSRVLNEDLTPSTDNRPRKILIKYQVDIDYLAVWQVTILAGEPVTKSWVAYKPTAVTLFGGDFTLQRKINKDYLKKIRLTEFIFRAFYYGRIGNQKDRSEGAAIEFDAGIPLKPYFGHRTSELVENVALFNQFASFNAPVSPDWDELFIGITKPARAKSLYRANSNRSQFNRFKDYSLEKLTLDTDAINEFLRKHIQALEKQLKAKAKKISSKKPSENTPEPDRKNQSDDALEDALAEIEQPGAGDPFDALADSSESSREDKDPFEAQLEETEQLSLTVDVPPRDTSTNVIRISGRINNYSSISGSSVNFQVNGLTQPVLLQSDGRFSNKVVLFNGDNTIDIDYRDNLTRLHKRLVVHSTTPPVKARFTLVWDSRHSDMDLHVEGPGGDHCSYSNKTTANMQLDVDNTKQYGPENISINLNGHPGRY